MPIYPIKTRLYEEPIEPELLLFVDFRYTNCYNGGTTITNLANGNTLNVGDGTIVGSPVFSPEEGGSFYFGPGSGIDFSTNSLQVSNRDYLTITAYVKFGVVSGFLGSSFFANSGSTSSPFQVGGDSHSFFGIIGNRFTFGNIVATAATYSLNEWYHVTWTKEPTGGASTESHLYRFYLNGELKETYVTRNNGTTSTNISVGYDKGIGSRFLGTIAQVKVWTSDASPLNTFKIVSESSSARFRPYTIGTKKTPSDIILYLADKGSRTGWGDNSMYSNGAVLFGGAQFNSGLILSNTSMYASGTLQTDPGQNFTISSFFNCVGTSTSGYHAIFSINTGSSGVSPSTTLILRVSDGLGVEFVYYDQGVIYSIPNVFKKNVLTHLAVTVSQSGGNRIIKLFVNGVLVENGFPLLTPASISLNFDFSTRNYKIGRWRDTGPFVHQFNGKIYNVILHNRTLSDDEIKDIYSAMPSSYKSNESTYNQEPQANKILYLDAAEPKSYYLTGATVRDLSSNNRNGTLTSDSGSLPTFSKFFAGHFQFKGLSTKSFISLAVATLPSGLAPYTVIFWMRPNNISKTQVLFMYGNESTNNLCRGVSIYLGRIYSFQDRIATNSLDSQISIEVGKWYQVAHTYTGSIESIYVNGILANSRPRSFLTNVNSPADFRIGAGFFKNPPTSGSIIDFYFDGDIGEFTMYDRALDPQEVYQDYFIKKNRYKALDVTRPSGSGAPTVPIVQTAIVTSITPTSAESGGAVLSIGGRALSARGIIWSTTIDPTLPSNYLGIDTDALTVQGSYISTINGLSSGQTYYVRAYATNQIGTGYGQSVEFVATATVIPGVIAVTASSVTPTTVGVTSSITSLGNAPSVSARGVIWNTTTIDPLTVNLSTYPRKLQETGAFNLGEYFNTVTSLSANTTYYLRAWASNSAGNKISDNEIVVRTKVAATPPTISVVDLFNDVTGNSVKIRLVTTGTGITQQGIVWNAVDTPNPNWETMWDTSITTSPNGGTFDLTTIGTLLPGTTYYFWGYMISPSGTVYSSSSLEVTTDGLPAVITQVLFNTGNATGVLTSENGSTVTEVGIVWGTTETVTFDSDLLDFYSELGPFTLPYSYSSLPPDLILFGTIFARAYAINAVGIYYDTALTADIIAFASVTTNPAQSIADPFVWTLRGNLLSLGGANSVEVGFYYGTGIPYTKIKITPNRTTIGQFSINTPTLTPGTYTFYAYAINGAGEQPGNQLTFTVASTIPTISTTYSNDIIISGGLTMELTATGITNNPTTRGFVWGSAINPTDALVTKTLKGTGNTGFTSSIPIDATSPGNAVIASDTDIYVRAYARNASGIGYSENIRIYSANIGSVLAINTGKLVYTGTISLQASNRVVEQGVVYSTSPITPAVLRSGDGYTLAKATLTTNAQNWGFGYNNNTDGVLITADSNTIYYARTYVKLNSTYGGHFVYSRERSTSISPIINSTVTISNITSSSMTITGTVTSDGNSPLTALGVCYSTSVSPTIANLTVSAPTLTVGQFSVTISGLASGTLYYFRVFATNASGTSYSPSPGGTGTTQITTSLASLTTAAITVFDGTTATLGGTITSDGNSPITERGVVYAFNQAPTTGNNKLVGAATTTFTVNATVLLPNTLYYVRAYAINGVGTSYGNELSFRTTTTPTLNFVSTANPTGTSITYNSNVTSNGGETLTARGVIWSTSPSPTIALSTKTNDGTAVGNIASSVTGLLNGTLYYLRGYATNVNGTTYTSDTTITTLSAPTVATSDFVFNNHGLIQQTFYPELSGVDIRTSATVTGQITNTGGSDVTESGFVWSSATTTPTLTTNQGRTFSTTVISANGTNISGLMRLLKNENSNLFVANQDLYYYRAYAINSIGTTLGPVKSFRTLYDPVIIPFETPSSEPIGSVTIAARIDPNNFGNSDLYSTGLEVGVYYGPETNINANRVIINSNYNLFNAQEPFPTNLFVLTLSLTAGRYSYRIFAKHRGREVGTNPFNLVIGPNTTTPTILSAMTSPFETTSGGGLRLQTTISNASNYRYGGLASANSNLSGFLTNTGSLLSNNNPTLVTVVTPGLGISNNTTYYFGVYLTNDNGSTYILSSAVPFLFEDIRFTNLTYNATTFTFTATVPFFNRTGRIMIQVGVAWSIGEPAVDPYFEPTSTRITYTAAGTNVVSDNFYSIPINGSGFTPGQVLRARAYVLVNGVRIFSFTQRTATRT